VRAQAGIETGALPITVTGARVLATARDAQIVKVALVVNVPLSEHRIPRRGLALAVPARHSLWIDYSVRLSDCAGQPAGVTRIRVSYRVLGLALSQTVSLGGGDTLLTCN
jgi:hypothetical protein